MLHFLKSNKTIFLSLLFAVILNYSSTLNNGFMIDDDIFLKGQYQSDYHSDEDFFTKSASQHFSPFYYWVNFTLFKYFENTPYVFHILNILLFYMSGSLFFLLVVQFSRSKSIAFLAALLIFFHPIHYFSVGYKTSNFVFYCAIFMEISLLLAWYAVAKKRTSLLLISMSCLFFVLALLSNEWAALLPFYLFFILYFLKDFKLKKICLLSIPYLLIDALFLFSYVNIAGPKMQLMDRIYTMNIPFFEFSAAFSYFFFHYVGNLIWPRDIVFMMNIIPPVGHLLFWNGLFYIGMISIVILIVFIWGKNLKSLALTWFLIGFILVVPALFSHINMGLVFEPHWLYFSSFGFFLLVATYLDRLRLKIKKVYFAAILSGILLFLFSTTQSFNYFTKTEKRYCQFLLKYYPQNKIALTTLGNIYFSEKQYDQSFQFYNRVIALGDVDRFKELTNIGLIYKELHKNEQAKYYFQKALELNPNFFIAYNNLGTIYEEEGDLIQAEYNYQKTIQLAPHLPEARLNLVNVFIKKEEWPKATHTLEAFELNKISTFYQRKVLIKQAVVASKIGNAQQSSFYVEQLCKGSNSVRMFLELSQEFVALKMYKQAFQILDAALLRFPKSKEIYLYYGVILGNNENWMGAINMWKRGKVIDNKEKKFDEFIAKATFLMQNDTEH